MKKWLKNNWLPLISILLGVTAINLSIIRVETLTLSDSWLAWAIGISVTIISIGVVIVLGYQIYNSTTLDKRMKEMFDERTNKVKEDLSISFVRSSTATLYQATGVGIKVDYAIKNFSGMIGTLNTMLGYALALNEAETLSDIAKLIVNSWELATREESYDKQLDHSFLVLAKAVLNRLYASDAQAPRLFEMINQIQSGQSNTTQNPKQE